MRASNSMYIFFKNYPQCFKIHLYLFTGYTYSSILWMLSFLLINICYTLYEWHNGSKIYILGCFELWELKHLQLFLFCQILKTLGDQCIDVSLWYINKMKDLAKVEYSFKLAKLCLVEEHNFFISQNPENRVEICFQPFYGVHNLSRA